MLFWECIARVNGKVLTATNCRWCVFGENKIPPTYVRYIRYDRAVLFRAQSEKFLAVNTFVPIIINSQEIALGTYNQYYPSILQETPSSKEHSSSLSFCPLAATLEKIINQKNDITAMNAMRRCTGTTPNVRH